MVPRGPCGQRPRAAQPGGWGLRTRAWLATVVCVGACPLHLHVCMPACRPLHAHARMHACVHSSSRCSPNQPGTSGIKGTPSALPSGLTAWEISPENSDGMLIRLAAISSEPPVTLRAYTHTPRIHLLHSLHCPFIHLHALTCA